MRTLKLTLQYDGTDYVGWQRQRRGVSVQGLLEQALERIEGQAVTVVGAGRTDAGAHALGQVASVRLRHPIDCAALVRAVNATLPPDVRVLAADEAAPGFHARHAARAKTYRYRVMTGPTASAFERRYAWHVTQALDVPRMMRAGEPLAGRHDFVAFQAAGSSTRSTVRTIFAVRWTSTPPGRLWHAAVDPVDGAGGSLVELDVEGDGFLRHMVRTLAGTLVEIGLGRRDVRALACALRSGDRRDVGPTAPPQGLFLVCVDYASGADRAGRAGPRVA